MRRNLWALGNRTISGQYRRIMSAGDLTVEGSDVLKLYCAGDIDIKESFIKKLRTAGDITVLNTSFDDVSVLGDIKLKGETEAGVFVVCGSISAEYLACKVLRNNAKSTRMIKHGSALNGKMSGFFKAETFENYKDTIVEFEYEFKNIISKSTLLISGPLECEKLFSFGTIKADEINADFAYIKPYASSHVGGITGSEVIISQDFKEQKILKRLPRSVNLGHYRDIVSRPSSVMSAGSVEADRIYVERLKAHSISGGEVVIGDLCIVDRVEYSKSIKISPKAVVSDEVRL